MKTMYKFFLLAVVMMISSFAAFAEEAPINRNDFSDPGTGFQWQVGDTIVIKENITQYLTGEKPSTWVYNVQRTIMQVGGKRFPNGLLISGIYSWLGKEDVLLKGFVARSTTPQNEAAEQKQTEDASEVNRILESAEPVVEEQPVVTPEPEPVVEPETPAVEEPVAEEVTEEAKEHNRLEPHHRFTIGLRGGVASLMHDAETMGDWKAGFDGLLDLQYAYYFGAKEGKKVNMGIITGVGLGWAQSGLKSSVDDSYTVNTPDGTIDYTINADEVKENDGQLQVEIPVMFSLITEKGLFFNVGPKVTLPVYTHYTQNITNPNIDAYFPTEGVHVSNEVVTGLVADNQMKTKGNWNASKINVMLTAELGYEFFFKKSGNSLGLGAYANYSVYDLYKNTTENKSLVGVTAPSATGSALVDVFSATDTYAKGLGYFDCGLKLAYHFNFFKK